MNKNAGRPLRDTTAVSQDDNQAFNWFVKAAEQEHDHACLNIGIMYMNNTPKSLKDAAIWINKARQLGNERAEILWRDYELSKYQYH